jgi:pimeloyl-ACP methyl ester carboxylesterase
MSVEKVLYQSIDGIALAGVFTAPPVTRAFVVMIHGLNVDKDEWHGFYQDMAAAFHDAGIASLRFDTRGHGESGGSQLDLSVTGATLDVRASIREVRKRWNGRVGLIATSFGAGPALFVATEMQETVPRVALIAPVLDYQATFLQPTSDWAAASFTRKALRELDDRGYVLLDGEFKLSARVIEEFRWLEPHRVLRSLAAPVLLIHGDRDSMVPFELSEKYFWQGEGSKFIRIPGADHGFPDYDDEEGTGPKSLDNKQRIFSELIDFCSPTGSEG